MNNATLRTADDGDVAMTPGADFTHWACPHCGDENETEGDAHGDIEECVNCGEKAHIT